MSQKRTFWSNLFKDWVCWDFKGAKKSQYLAFTRVCDDLGVNNFCRPIATEGWNQGSGEYDPSLFPWRGDVYLFEVEAEEDFRVPLIGYRNKITNVEDCLSKFAEVVYHGSDPETFDMHRRWLMELRDELLDANNELDMSP